MQQDLLSVQANPDNIDDVKELNWRDKIRQKLARPVVRQNSQTPTAMEIMSTSIQVLENRLKRYRMAGDPPDVVLQPFCPQISTLDFHRAEEAIEAGRLAVEKQMDQLLPLVKNNHF